MLKELIIFLGLVAAIFSMGGFLWLENYMVMRNDWMMTIPICINATFFVWVFTCDPKVKN